MTMHDKIDQGLQDALLAVLEAGFSDRALKSARKRASELVGDLETDLEWSLKDSLAPMLVGWVAGMAERAVEQLLAGNEEQMRRYLSCEKRASDGKYLSWTGRNDDGSYPTNRPESRHPVIHGKLHESSVIELRRKIVDAHRDLLVSERIKDLEDQVKSLVAQVNQANAEKDRMWERLRGAA